MRIFKIAQESNSNLSSSLSSPSSPSNLDETYFKLLRAKDYNKAREMVLIRAQEKGYNFGPIYHGSDSSFTKFNLNYSGQRDDGYYGRGFYFTMLREIASEYGAVKTFLISTHNPLKLPSAATMGHSSLIQARDVLGRVMDRQDLIPDMKLPEGYEVKKVKEKQWGSETGKEGYEVYPKKELWGSGSERYGDFQLTPEEAIVSFTDQLRDTSWNCGWLMGLTKDIGRDKMMKAIKAKGYDSLMIVDAEFDVGAVDEIVIWEPSKIKLISVKTTDNGQTIPLSRRFDFGNEDFRY